MKNNENVSFKANRLVFKLTAVPAQAAAPEVADQQAQAAPVSPEAQREAELAAAHEQALQALAASKDDPAKLPAAYGDAMASLENIYRSQNKAAIESGTANLRDMLSRLGVSEEDATGIEAQYKAAFENEEGEEDGYRADIALATQKQATEEVLPQLKEMAQATIDANYNPQKAQLEGSIANASGEITKQDEIIGKKDEEIDGLDDTVSDNEGELNDYLDKYDFEENASVDLKREDFKSKVKKKVEDDSDVDEDGAENIARDVEDTTDRVYAKYQRLARTLTENKARKQEAERAKSVAEEAKKVATTLKEDQERFLTNLTKEYTKTTEQITDGTYVPAGSTDTLEAMALLSAEMSIEDSQAEKEVMERYAKITQDKTRELLTGIVIGRLNVIKAGKAERITTIDGEIQVLKDADDEKIKGIQKRGKEKMEKYGFSNSLVEINDLDLAFFKERVEKQITASELKKADDDDARIKPGAIGEKVGRVMAMLTQLKTECKEAIAFSEANPAVKGKEAERLVLLGEMDDIDVKIASLSAPAQEPEVVPAAPTAVASVE